MERLAPGESRPAFLVNVARTRNVARLYFRPLLLVQLVRRLTFTTSVGLPVARKTLPGLTGMAALATPV